MKTVQSGSGMPSGAGECSPLHRDCMGLNLSVGDEVFLIDDSIVSVVRLLPDGQFAFLERGVHCSHPCRCCIKVKA